MFWNAIKTVVFLGALSGLLLFLGYLMGGTGGLTIAFLLALVMNGIGYFYSDQIVLKMYRGKPLDQEKFGFVYEIVEEICQRANMPMPKLWLIESPVANAFATGRNPKHASVAVTKRILEILEPRELRGVLAHEMSHVKNRDVLVSTIAAVFATTISYVANMLYHSTVFRRQDQGQGKGNPIFVLIATMLLPFAASLIQFAISRSREYMADESGAHICEDPIALANALEKLQMDSQGLRNKKDVVHAPTASLFIVNPFSTQGVMALLSTHPPMQDRVAKLHEMAKEMERTKRRYLDSE